MPNASVKIYGKKEPLLFSFREFNVSISFVNYTL
jgi:hypothetical protein